MFRGRKRTKGLDQADRYDSAVGGEDVAFTSNLLPRSCLPEISLVAAIFEDAVCCVQRASRGVTYQQSAEAAEWIASERRDWPFAFINVCDFLGIDAMAVRARLGAARGRASR